MEEKKEILTEEIKMDNDPKGEGKEKATSPLREVLSWVSHSVGGLRAGDGFEELRDHQCNSPDRIDGAYH